MAKEAKKNVGPYYILNECQKEKGNVNIINISGFLGRDPFYIPAKGDKKAVAFTSLGLGDGSEWEIYGRITGKGYAKREVSHFLSLVSKNESIAKKMKNLKKGTRVNITGDVTEEITKDKNDNEYKAVRVRVEAIQDLSIGAEVNGTYGAYSKVYEDRDTEEEVTKPVAYGIGGEITWIGDIQEDDYGNSFFSVKINTEAPMDAVYAKAIGTYSKKKEYDNNSCFVTVIYKDEESLEKALAKLEIGTKVVVTGILSEREKDDNTTYQITVRGGSGSFTSILEEEAPKKGKKKSKRDDNEDDEPKVKKSKKVVDDDDEDDDEPPKKSKSKKVVDEDDDEDYEPPKKSKSKKPSIDDEDDDDDDEDEDYEPPKKSKSRKSVSIDDDDDDDDLDELINELDDDDEDDD